MIVIAALYMGRGVLIPITLAVLLSFIVAPLLGLRRPFKSSSCRRWSSRCYSRFEYWSDGMLIGAQAGQQSKDLPQYQRTVEAQDPRRKETLSAAQIRCSRGQVDQRHPRTDMSRESAGPWVFSGAVSVSLKLPRRRFSLCSAPGNGTRQTVDTPTIDG
jgi:hypothetical protein